MLIKTEKGWERPIINNAIPVPDKVNTAYSWMGPGVGGLMGMASDYRRNRSLNVYNNRSKK